MGRQSHYAEHRDDVLNGIRNLTQKLGKAPSIREVAREVDVSITTLHAYLTKLKEEGLVSWTERTHRSLRLINDTASVGPGENPPPTPVQPASQPVPQPAYQAATPVPPSPPPVRFVDPSLDVGF